MLNQLFRYIKLHFLSLFVRHPLSEKRESPVFILSAGRSGSTLLRKILLRSSFISIPPETHSFIPDSLFLYLKHNHLPWDELIDVMVENLKAKQYFKYWNIPIQENELFYLKYSLSNRTLEGFLHYFYDRYAKSNQPDFLLWGDKTPLLVYHTDIIQKIFPNAKYIFLIRDGRDVISSFMSHNLYMDLKYLCRRWLISVKQEEKIFKKKGINYVLSIRYENLVNHPEQEAIKICRFLNIPFKDYYLKNTAVYLGDDQQPHFTETKEEINVKRIGTWKDLLNDSQKELIKKIIGRDLHSRGYR